MTEAINTIKDNLSRLMRERGTNATRLAREAGVSDSAVKDFFRDRNKNPGINLLIALAETLKCTVAEIIGETETLKRQDAMTVELVLDAMSALDRWMDEHRLALPDPDYKREIVVRLAMAALEEEPNEDGSKVIDIERYSGFINFA